jgi:CubicO group peptidase (beta-lactamase class C family)
MNTKHNVSQSRRSFLQSGSKVAGAALLAGFVTPSPVEAAPAVAGTMAARGRTPVRGKTTPFAATPVQNSSGEYQPTTPVYGTFDDRFRPVHDAFAKNLDTGQDIGASLAIFIEGEPVLDLWGGYWDMTYTREWERDTIVNTFSTTKTMTGLCALLLADRGELDLDARVAKYWPEFAAEGKSEIKVRQLLDYTSGMAGWTEAVTLNDLYDWEKSTDLLARQAPWWEPGTAVGYHAFTLGHLVGEVVRRITGKSMGTFFAEEIAGPFNAEYYIGTGPEHDHQVSLMIQGYPIKTKGHELYERALFNPPASPFDSWAIAWRRAELGANNGHGNARGIATVQSILAHGGVHGVTLMSEAGREKVLEHQNHGFDVILDLPINFGLGYAVENIIPGASGSRVAFWGGNGGSISWVDLDHRMSVGYAPNHWIAGPHELDRVVNILNAVYESLK